MIAISTRHNGEWNVTFSFLPDDPEIGACITSLHAAGIEFYVEEE